MTEHGHLATQLPPEQVRESRDTLLEFMNRLSTGTPISIAGGRARVVPLVLDRPPLLLPPRDHVLLREVLGKGVEVRECAGGATVPALELENTLDTKVLAVEGELLRGCQQNRVINAALMAAPGTKVRIPVSCVQQGRWSYLSDAMQPARTFAPRRVRQQAKQAVHASMVSGRGREADQGAVWGSVNELEREMEHCSSTSDLLEALDHHTERPEVGSLHGEIDRGLRGAVGYALALDGAWQSLELVGHPEDFERLRSTHAAALATELVQVRARPDQAAPESVSDDPVATVRALMENGLRGFAGVALGHELRAQSPRDKWALSVLVEGGQMRLLSALTEHEPRPAPEVRRPRRSHSRWPIHTTGGHAIARIEDQKVLLDTGSTHSFGTGQALQLDGEPLYLPPNDRMLRWLALRLRTRIDAVLGWDILRAMSFQLDPGRRTFSIESAARPAGERTLRLLPGTQVPTVRIDGPAGHAPAILDTGARLSYVPDHVVEGQEPLYLTSDFHPTQEDFFTTPIYRVRLNIAGQDLRIRAGTLPPDLRGRLGLDDRTWILGSDLFRRARVTYDGRGSFHIAQMRRARPVP